VPLRPLDKSKSFIGEGELVVKTAERDREVVCEELFGQGPPHCSIPNERITVIRERERYDPLAPDIRDAAEGEASHRLTCIVNHDIRADIEVVRLCQHP